MTSWDIIMYYFLPDGRRKFIAPGSTLQFIEFGWTNSSACNADGTVDTTSICTSIFHCDEYTGAIYTGVVPSPINCSNLVYL